MSAEGEKRAAVPLTQRGARLILGSAVLLAAGAAAVSLANADAEHRVFSAVSDSATIAILFGVGLFAWRRDPANRIGRLLVIAGFGWFLVSMAASDLPALYSLGRVAAWPMEVLLIYLFLSYPFGRLPDAASRAVVLTAFATAAILFVPTALVVQQFPSPSPYALCTGSDCPVNAFALTSAEPGFVDDLIRPLREVLAAGVFLSTALILALRMRRATIPMRHTLSPVLVAAAFGAAAACLYLAVRRTGIAGESTLELLAAVRSLATPVAAVGILVGLLAWQLREARALERLALASTSSAGPEELQRMLSVALEDPTLEVRYRDNGGGGWRNVHGERAAAPRESDDRCVVGLGNGDATAAILCDPALKGQRRLVEAAGSWIGTSIEQQRLNSLLEVTLHDVEESRRRLATAAATERRRIERDLHDGAQQRLVTLRVELGLIGEELKRDPVAGQRRLRELGTSIDAVIDDVRSLAHGIYPPLLADAGLAEALRAVARREALPVTVGADNGTRYPLEVESAVYFCCLEALQNAAKHSAASSVEIQIHAEGDGLRFEVRDDGQGFMFGNQNGGAGLTNMRDRLAALGGRLSVESAPGRGTRVIGSAPAEVVG
jgi:signal transduction histidine kinase